MKVVIRYKSLATLLLLAPIFVLSSCSSGASSFSADIAAQSGIHPEQGCTIFYAADEDVALAGNNEDYDNPYTYVWFVPPEEGKYGRVYFGYEDGFPQGGVNEAGLFFDGASLPYKPLSADDRPVYDGIIPRGLLFDKILSECATIAEVLEVLESYSHEGMDTYHLLFGDASGDSVIVDGDTILRSEGSFQLITNFRLTETPDPPYPCHRFDTALEMLTEAESFSNELFRDILDATHQEPPDVTIYSNVYDLRNGLIYLYYERDFENAAVIEVAAELAEGFHFSPIAALFPDNPQAADFIQGLEDEDQLISLVGSVPFDDYVGEYRVGETGEPVSVYVEEESLYVWQRFSLPIELIAEPGDRFAHVFHDGNVMTLDFERDSQGIVVGASGMLFGVDFQLERVDPVQSAPVPDAVDADDSADAVPWWAWALGAVGIVAVGLGGRLWFVRRARHANSASG